MPLKLLLFSNELSLDQKPEPEEGFLEKLWKSSFGSILPSNDNDINRKGRQKTEGSQVLDTIGKIAAKSIMNIITREITNYIVPPGEVEK